MARTTPVKKAWRNLAWLGVIIVALVGLNFYGQLTAFKGVDGSAFVPKLALDLEGGTEIILAPVVTEGQTVTAEQLAQAVTIIRQRVDASGVSEAEINTQGASNIVVSIPDKPDAAQLKRIESSSKLEFRAVLRTDAANASSVGGSSTASASPIPAPTESLSDSPTLTRDPTNASDDAYYVSPAILDEYTNYSCEQLDDLSPNTADPTKALVVCDSDGVSKYILGPVEVAGDDISDATNSIVTNSQGASTGQWAVNIVFNSDGTKKFADTTTRLYSYLATDTTKNRFAVVLDGRVITAPSTNAAISDGKPQITGNFTQASSKTLADQLKFGALPIGFTVQSLDNITATLGKTQLISGLIAGLIGLILVVLYSLLQYRALASITIASLVISAVITYLTVDILSWREGYRLSLAGVAGLIVAIGITADSFIVYFERIRDELRDGRTLESSVEAGWRRAIRTILASDTVNFLAAATLFVLAVGNVKGFALTLGLTTIIDVIVVALFTHPMLQLLSRVPFFSEGHRFSGLDPKALGAIYRGRAAFRTPAIATAKQAGATREAARRQTIAERKAAEANDADSRSKGKDS